MVHARNEVSERTLLLQMNGICKSFPGVNALQDVDLTLHAGEVLALMGENGAGKSMLMKVLGGAHRSDAGSIFIDGKPVVINSPVEARNAGVGMIYQEFNLIPYLSARENLFLGQESSKIGFIAQNEERSRAKEIFEHLGVDIDPEERCANMTVAQQQIVEIAKALVQNARIIVMDEPSATLTIQEVERLFKLVRDLVAQGIGIIYISHRMDEIFEIADSVMVMRDGTFVDCCPISEIDRQRLIELMVGRTLDQEYPGGEASIGDECLVVRGLCKGKQVQDVSFSVRSGEIVALTGLVGAGRTETARLIFGADILDSGSIKLDGRLLRVKSPADAMRAGIAFLPEDRKSQGLVLGLSVRENFGLPSLDQFVSSGFINQADEQNACAHYVSVMQIKISDQEQIVSNLSGGNQQKVVLAKWLQRDCRVIIFDEPTRGIDVGAKREIYSLMRKLAADGKAILMISSELPEVLGMADRILVMHDGRITGEIIDVSQAAQEDIMRLAIM